MVADKEKQKAQDSDHWERKNKRGEPWDALSHFQGWETKTELNCLAGLRRQSSEFGEARATRIYRTEYRRAGSSRDLQWSHLSLWVMACQMWENYQRKEKKLQKRVSETVTDRDYSTFWEARLKRSHSRQGIKKSVDVESHCLRKVLSSIEKSN